jgi:hypothetical protein
MGACNSHTAGFEKPTRAVPSWGFTFGGRRMPENQVRLTVQTLSGTFEDKFNVHQKLQHVIDKAFHELHIQPAEGEVWELRYNGQVLDPNRTIEAAHIPDGAVLKLAPREGGGGCLWTLR